MSTTQSKTDLVRLAWLTELRRQGDRQCTGTYREGDLVCALGLLAEIAGVKVRRGEAASLVGAFAGLDIDQSYYVSSRNDGGWCDDNSAHYHRHTFAEIAAVVAGWFTRSA